MTVYRFTATGTCSFTTCIEADTPEEGWARAKDLVDDRWRLNEDSAIVAIVDAPDNEFTSAGNGLFRGIDQSSMCHDVEVLELSDEMAEIALERWRGSYVCADCGAGAMLEGSRSVVCVEHCPVCSSLNLSSEACLISKGST